MENEDRLKDAEQGDSKVGGGQGLEGLSKKAKDSWTWTTVADCWG